MKFIRLIQADNTRQNNEDAKKDQIKIKQNKAVFSLFVLVLVYRQCVEFSVVSRKAVCLDLCCLYFLYNDITECTDENVSVKLFADDAKIYTVITDGKTSSNQLQQSLD